MRILFIGESWLGSCARSLREALTRCDGVEMDDLAEDAWFTKPHTRWLRALNRITNPAYRREFNAAVLSRVREFRPDAVVVYKGHHVGLDLIQAIQREDVRTVNVYPDCSPHAQGASVKQALGGYDLVISTKVYQPALWEGTYGYKNRCVFVGQGYDPVLHQRDTPEAEPKFDVVLVATWRAEYGRLMSEFARYLDDPTVSVAIGGNGWRPAFATLPPHWIHLGERSGQSYVEALRSGSICIAPLTRLASAGGLTQPGDVDTTRTYELAAAHCFFIHRRTEFVKTVYDEANEVPMFDDAAELAAHVRHYLAHPDTRMAMAAAAHHRAVPDCSMDQRASAVVAAIEKYT